MNASLGKWLLLVFIFVAGGPLCFSCADDVLAQSQSPFENSPKSCACFCHSSKTTNAQEQTSGDIQQIIKYISYLPSVSSCIETAAEPSSAIRKIIALDATPSQNPALPKVLRI